LAAETAVDGIFAGGDAARTGTKPPVAIAKGRLAAEGIERVFRDEPSKKAAPVALPSTIEKLKLDWYPTRHRDTRGQKVRRRA